MEKIKKLFATAASRNGSYSVGLIAMAVAAVILFNLVVGQLPESVKQADISDNRLYEITQVSRELIDGLEEQVSIKVLQNREDYDDRLVRFLENYAALSGNISLEWIDPVLHPSALTEYETEQNNLVVSCETTGKQKVVEYYDMIVPDYSSYYMTGSATEGEFDAEGQLTSALSYVTAGTEHAVYYTSGHGELEFSSQVQDLMEKISASLAEVNLLMTGSVPEDCELLILNGPTSDLTEDEAAALRNYMSQGGKVMILLAATESQQPNLEALLQEYGMTVKAGYAADMQRNLQGNYYWIFPEITAYGDLTEGMETGMLLMLNSRGMEESDPARDTIALQGILETSSEGYMVTEESQEQGTYLLGAVATETLESSGEENADESADAGDGTEETEESTEATEETGDAADSSAKEEKESRLTVLASNSLIDGDLTSMYGTLENLTMFMNLVTANLSNVTNISIEPKSLAITYNTMQHVGALGFAAVIGVPAVFLLGGFLQWRRRRKA